MKPLGKNKNTPTYELWTLSCWDPGAMRPLQKASGWWTPGLGAGPGSGAYSQSGPVEKSAPGADCEPGWGALPPGSGLSGTGFVFEGQLLCFQTDPGGPLPPAERLLFGLRTPEKSP